ncbi:transposase for IS1668 [Yersinia enterocolitica subsp. palearctica Y11]|uniref:Transposase for IS1668 n=1 Tax=Yersinia enterocolitica subsp. palearctica serotype O:3 (strain DSM 13030 / CIP 106945 / Y11) TaxID=930944 RepID=A0A0H3NRC4_YERE1|nr:transposase for IS1668 [Yersinia enterocolitica subsp. palearctica Y11]CCO69026.1 Mobile element protein [Yersinia enterocolitica IP 10393]
MGYRRPNKGQQNVLQKKHFIYDAEQDVYQCPQGQQLIDKTTSREGYRHYHSSPEICGQCPRLTGCTKRKNSQKVVTRHV